jgi:hypothetical protein
MRRLIVAVFLIACTSPLHGQSMSERFYQLFTFGDCGEALCLEVNQAQHGSHYIPGVAQGSQNLLNFVTNAIGLTIGQLPFAAATGGVTYTFERGVPVASAVSAGPIFADRAETLGRGRLLLGGNVSGFSFTKLRGVSLDDLLLNFPHQNVQNAAYGDPFFEHDYVEVVTNLDVSLLVTSIFFAYGLSDRMDIGISLPIVRSSLDGTSRAEIRQMGSSPHFFGTPADPSTSATATASGSATGIGDIAGRIKVNVAQTSQFGLSLIADVRAGTGSQEDFHGSGATTFRIFGATSARYGSFSPHLNGGFLLTSADYATNRVLGTLGFDYLLGEQVTFAAELVGSFETGDSKLLLPEPVVFTSPTVETLELTDIPDKNDNFVDASVGAKIQAGQSFRIVTNVLIPLANAGMRPTVGWTVGLERVF